MSKEYVIWGVCGDDPDEQVLLTMLANGKPIPSRDIASKLMEYLAKHRGCHGMRIQEIDGALPDFAGAISR